MDLLLRNGTVVNEGEVFKGSIVICGERISRIIREADFHQEDFSGMETLDMTGLHIFPGVIDTHVHFREPGGGRKANIESESKAAVLGGVTSFMDMPNNTPPALTLDLLEDKFKSAEKTSFANYSFYLGASNSNLGEIKKINRKEICGVKLFMGASTGGLLVDDESALENVFRFSPTLIAVHCEDSSLISANLKKAIEKYGADIPAQMHPKIRSRQCCLKSTEKALYLANKHKSRLHILHVTTKEEAELISAQPENITAETAPSYLWFCDKDYKEYGNLIKCNPSIKGRGDMLSLRKALKEGAIKTVGSDHAPHLLGDKLKPYTEAPSGIPLMQYTLMMMLTLAKRGEFSLTDIAEHLSHSPAECFKVEGRGFIREGYYADFAIVDLEKPYMYIDSPDAKCGWSPFSQKGIFFHPESGKDEKINTFPASVVHTIVNGCVTVRDGRLTQNRNPKRLTFDR
ncbi:MAG: amidohydrolase family protein [Bacteroidales bacterium]|nr:amidohydrolase family protein [Bacteroidales bacterium]